MSQPAQSGSGIAITRCGENEFRWGEKTYVMGIINLSPDSFSGDAIVGDVETVLAKAERMVADGADIIDLGGESTRPGAKPVPAEEEMRRVIPAIERLSRMLPAPVSIDTSKSEVARQAIRAGARMINDIWGLKHDSYLAQVVAEASIPLVLVSNQRGSTAQGDIIEKVISDLRRSIDLAMRAGIPEENIIVDPGIGFGKSIEQNLEIINRLAELKVLRRPVLLGTSRKFMPRETPEIRLSATAATIAIGIARGADMVRVHDVQQMAAVCRLSDAIVRGRI